MTPFTTLTSIAAPLRRSNIDTDMIIPSREMRSTGRTGLADGLFAPWRYIDADARIANPDFVLNQPEFSEARILLGGGNFGCGSSREHAVWALMEWGIRCIIAPGFAPIFANNCVRNGLLPVVLDDAVIASLSGQIVAIDLASQSVAATTTVHSFAIDAEAKAMLLAGMDAIDLTMQSQEKIAAWRVADRVMRPWVYLERQS